MYTTKSGDTWDSIARVVYGDEYQAGRLMEANREHIGVFVFSGGVRLNTPAVESGQDGTLPPWKYGGDDG